VIAARADLVLLATRDGGLKSAIGTPCRSLILHTNAGRSIGAVTLGVLISTPFAEPHRAQVQGKGRDPVARRVPVTPESGAHAGSLEAGGSALLDDLRTKLRLEHLDPV
jgi:hypothetical protein